MPPNSSVSLSRTTVRTRHKEKLEPAQKREPTALCILAAHRQVEAEKRETISDANTPRNDEIDLYVLWRNMWAARIPVLLAVAAVTLGYWGFWAVQHLRTPPVYSYSHIVRFTFEGAD